MPQQDKEKCDMLNIQRQALARNIARQTEQNHRLETAVPGLVLVRYEAPTQPASCMYEPTICLVAQGAKRVMLGDEEYLYDANHYLISSVGLLVVANVVEASPEVPLLGMVLKLDMRMLAQMMVDSNLPVTRAAKSGRGMRVSEVCMPLLNAFQRLLDLHDHPQDIAVLSPLIHKEILYRLLLGEQGHYLRQIVAAGSHGFQIAQAIDWLKKNYVQPLKDRQPRQADRHEHFNLPFAFSRHDQHEPAAIPKVDAPARGQTPHVHGASGRHQRRLSGGVRKPLAIQPRISPPVRHAAPARH